ncbi:hypothetical protein MTR_4g008350 [Medicago truncatula]|uniref:Uncharacterized protein n=1 Tax=Medicago truncatula TaxID=3880 RepID=A0A072UFU7_MEDTR|nr:hypothetical protein MTR_4g008350 [Medicago truncatula]
MAWHPKTMITDKMTIRKDYGDYGEQVWKLPINSSFILTRVLKDKYFPRNGFLDAKLGNSPSYTWRSIWSTIPLLTLGYRWRIGDGKSINVWSDLWIRTRNNMKPTTTPLYHHPHLMISQLFDHQQNTWDLTLLNSIMNTQDKNHVLLHFNGAYGALITRAATNAVQDFRWCTQAIQHSQDHTSTPPPIVSLEKPGPNWFKCNMDCALFTDKCCFGVGICFCDSTGTFGSSIYRVFFLYYPGYRMSYLSDHASFKLAFIREQANRAAHIFARASVFQSKLALN